MTGIQKRSLYWAPRILGILMAIFTGLFAIDVFGEGYSFWRAVGAFFIHLAPTYLVVLVLILAWRWEWIGAVAYAGLAIFYVLWSGGRSALAAYLAISGPLLVIGALFLLNWLLRRELRSARAGA